jgi:hypothetical protein
VAPVRISSFLCTFDTNFVKEIQTQKIIPHAPAAAHIDERGSDDVTDEEKKTRAGQGILASEDIYASSS